MLDFVKKIGKEKFPYIPKFVYLLVVVLVVLVGASIYADKQLNKVNNDNQNQEIQGDTTINNSAALYIISPTETTMVGFPAEISGATSDPNIKNVVLYINEQDVLVSSRIQTEVVGAEWIFNQTNGLQTGFKIGENHLRFMPLYEGESAGVFNEERSIKFSLELVLTVVDLQKENKIQEINVKWLEQPVKSDFFDFFDSYYNTTDASVAERIQKRIVLYQGILPKNNDMYGGGIVISSVSAYKTGVVQGGEYDGYNTYVFSSGQCQELESMGCTPAFYRILKDPITTQILLLEKYSTKIAAVETSLFDKVLTETTIAGFQIPSDFSLKGYEMRKAGYWYTSGESWFFDQELTPITTHPDYGIVYTPLINAGQARPNNALYIKLPDDRVVAYTFDVPFMPDGETMPLITWKDGKNKADYYYKDRGGCGATNEFAVRSEKELQPDKRLVWDGDASNGDKIYILRDKQDSEYKTMYDLYSPYLPEGETKISFDEYVARRPLFYWQDNFGRWIKFSRTDNLPQAECGKPVIYLYPEKEMVVKVRVDLHGPMTKSEPEHGKQGWIVVAKSDGYVVNKADGKTYPNLFWEGYGVNYEIPKQGFVVKKEEAGAWLEKTLKEIGFTERENKEFREFWVPRLPNAPYVFITFVDQKYFDRDAALQIVPKPDHVYRIFMETSGLAESVVVTPLTLPKIIRDGFTVVEWGGALR